MMTEFLAGKGSMRVNSSAMNSLNSSAVKDPSTTFTQIIPSRESAGKREYLLKKNYE
jgi:hypothetical protein